MDRQILEILSTLEVTTFALLIAFIALVVLLVANRSGSKTLNDVLKLFGQLTDVQIKLQDNLTKLQENDEKRVEAERQRGQVQDQQLRQIELLNKTMTNYHGSFDSSFETIATQNNKILERLDDVKKAINDVYDIISNSG